MKRKIARIMYITNKEREGYIVELLCGKDWVMNSFFPLTRRENAEENEEKDFIHFSILNKINELQRLNYKIVFE